MQDADLRKDAGATGERKRGEHAEHCEGRAHAAGRLEYGIGE